MTKYYYDNQDLRLLLDMLDVSHGSATCFRVLALFDSEFNDELVVPDIIFPSPPKMRKLNTTDTVTTDIELKVNEKNLKNYDLEIKFQDAPSKDGILKFLNGSTFQYVISLYPTTKRTSIITLSVISETQQSVGCENDVMPQTESLPEYSCMLEDLDVSTEYIIRINTVVNGKVLGHITEFFGPIKYKIQ